MLETSIRFFLKELIVMIRYISVAYANKIKYLYYL